jgi:hypothetical protein
VKCEMMDDGMEQSTVESLKGGPEVTWEDTSHGMGKAEERLTRTETVTECTSLSMTVDDERTQDGRRERDEAEDQRREN